MSEKLAKLKQDYTYMTSELKVLKALLDGLGPNFDNLSGKVNILHSQTKNAASSIKSLNLLMKKLLQNIGKSLGYHITGENDRGQKYFNKSQDNLLSIIPKILAKILAGTRAGGGEVGANNAYLIGEKGPEIFVPRSSGNIIANHQIGARPITLVMNITTPDAYSFRKSQQQILAESYIALQRAGRNI
jgi:hypothetical protein